MNSKRLENISTRKVDTVELYQLYNLGPREYLPLQTVCAHCQGRYGRDKLHVHLKQLMEGHGQGRTEALREH